MSLVLDEHRELLSDDARLRAFQAALTDVIKPHHIVLDLASGTGILGLLACRAGAKRVYSVDEGGIVQMARDIARANGVADRLTVIKGLSTRIELPERVDVVVADQAGRFGFDAGIVSAFADARERLLKPGGVMMPAGIDLVVAPVSAPDVRAWIEFWDKPRFGFDLTAARSTAENTGYPVKLRADQILGPPQRIAALDFASGVPDTIYGEATLAIERDGTLHGIGGWFTAPLSSRISLTNSPLAAGSIARRNVVLPIATPVSVRAGDRVHVSMTIVHELVHVRWSVTVTDAAGVRRASFSHSTWRGMLLCAEDLERMRPGRAVDLSRWGLARRTLLELCDGVRTSADIEEALREKHPELFPSRSAAAQFVAEVVVPYSR